MAEQFCFDQRNDTIDLNDAETWKWYLVGTSNANKPDGTEHELGYVNTINMGYTNGVQCLLQIYTSRGDTALYIRHRVGSEWKAWLRL